ncbi:hypothetical protein A2U01_0092333, partial [Trifolium medium]|nr:hypothetical protein [Trifolium medium]
MVGMSFDAVKDLWNLRICGVCNGVSFRSALDGVEFISEWYYEYR